MALALENANLVRQKVFGALGNQSGTASGSGDPYAFYAFKAFFLNWAANKGNANLQFIPIDGGAADSGDSSASVDDSAGQDHGIDEACRVYAIYLKKKNTGTDTFYALLDNATTDSHAAGLTVVEVALVSALQQAVIVSPQGFAITLGLVSAAYTTFTDSGGTTHSLSVDTPNGFIIAGAAA